jgi:3-oxoacyl-[acyl-carrier-protein] synthase-3
MILKVAGKPMKKAFIRCISKYLPQNKVTNEDLLKFNPNLDIAKLEKKIGLKTRYYAGENETATDMAYLAAKNLFAEFDVNPNEIDFVILCTQSPDYYLPTSACILQERLGLKTTTGAFDFNLGCSGYVYGLAIAKGLIETGSASKVLLITSETYSKYVNKKDNVVLPLFGDAATATLIDSKESSVDLVGPFSLNTDGSGYDKLIIQTGGSRNPKTPTSSIEKEDEFGNIRSEDDLYMSGTDIFNFTIEEIPKSVNDFCCKNQLDLSSFDYAVFHQANSFMLEYIRKKLAIDITKYCVDLASYANTVSSTIPLALIDLMKKHMLESKQQKSILLCGFGVGLSWGITKIIL